MENICSLFVLRWGWGGGVEILVAVVLTAIDVQGAPFGCCSCSSYSYRCPWATFGAVAVVFTAINTKVCHSGAVAVVFTDNTSRSEAMCYRRLFFPKTKSADPFQ